MESLSTLSQACVMENQTLPDSAKTYYTLQHTFSSVGVYEYIYIYKYNIYIYIISMYAISCMASWSWLHNEKRSPEWELRIWPGSVTRVIIMRNTDHCQRIAANTLTSQAQPPSQKNIHLSYRTHRWMYMCVTRMRYFLYAYHLSYTWHVYNILMVEIYIYI